jgi:hypothetical protein
MRCVLSRQCEVINAPSRQARTHFSFLLVSWFYGFMDYRFYGLLVSRIIDFILAHHAPRAGHDLRPHTNGRAKPSAINIAPTSCPRTLGPSGLFLVDEISDPTADML